VARCQRVGFTGPGYNYTCTTGTWSENARDGCTATSAYSLREVRCAVDRQLGDLALASRCAADLQRLGAHGLSGNCT
jgi:hypothetical protein